MESIIAMEQLLNATEGIEGILESTLWALDHHTDHSKKLFWISEAIGFADRQLQVIENGLRSAIRGHLDVNVLTATNLTQATSELVEYADRTGLLMPSDHTASLQYMPISIAPSADGFDIFVHVPLYREDSTMNLFQHLPMPLPLDDDVFLMVDADHDTIAVSQDNSLYRLTLPPSPSLPRIASA